MNAKLDGALRNSEHFRRFAVAKLFAFHKHERMCQSFRQFAQCLFESNRAQAMLLDRDLIRIIQSHRCLSAPSHAIPLVDGDPVQPRGYARATFESLSSRVSR